MLDRLEGMSPDTVQLRSGRIFDRGGEWLGTLANGERERVAREWIEDNRNEAMRIAMTGTQNLCTPVPGASQP